MALTFSQAPYVRANSSVFGRLMNRASRETVRIGLVGDSRWTFPGGNGPYFFSEFQARLIQRFGSLSETCFATPSNFADPAGTGARFAMMQANQGGAAQYASSFFPPGYSGPSQTLLNNGTGANGVLAMCDPGCAHIIAAAYTALESGKYFNSAPLTGGATTGKARIWAVTYAAGGDNELNWRHIDNTSGSVIGAYSGTVRASGSTSLGLDASGFALKSVEIPYTLASSANYPAFVVASKNASPKGVFFGLQYLDATKTNGATAFMLSAGGYQASSFITNHGNSSGFWRDFPLHLAIFGYGTNDGANNVSATTFKTNTLANIDFVRAVKSIPIVLCASPYNSDINSATENQYAGVLNEIVDERPNVCFINLRRMLDEQGFNGSNANVETTWMTDGVHMTEFGQRTEANLLVSALLSLADSSSTGLRNRQWRA